ncbi:MAG: hypothetical protein IJR59_06960 [Firmicutes bacterium]|nr:hypothetical protein [Bacillota bacterium]
MSIQKSLSQLAFETACGLNSLIKRETQIITQISDAEKIARKFGCLDAELEVLSRLALTTAMWAGLRRRY